MLAYFDYTVYDRVKDWQLYAVLIATIAGLVFLILSQVGNTCQ